MAIIFKITPMELLAAANITVARARGNYFTTKYCPFCDGGRNHDKLTFIVHQEEGNFKCTREKCGRKGNFWQLIESFNLDPREYVEKYTKF